MVAAGSEPTSPAAANRWLNRLGALTHHIPEPIDQRDAGQSRIVHAWFRQHPAELDRVLSLAAAREICRKFGCFPRGEAG